MSKTPDEIKYHILGVIHSLTKSYCLTLDDIAHHMCYVESFAPEDVCHDYDKYVQSYEECDIADLSTYADASSDCAHDDSNSEYLSSNSQDGSRCSDAPDSKTPIYVSSRREFCQVMSKGIKICPQYASCADDTCDRFHIHPEFLCPHDPKGSYCDDEDCDLIVIKPCRRGKRCNDIKCSFRH